MRASDLLGRIVYESGEPAGRVVDLVAHPDAAGNLFVDAAMVTPGRRGRLLGYEREALERPWPLRRIADWLHHGIHETSLDQLRLTAEPHRPTIVHDMAGTDTAGGPAERGTGS